MKFRQAFFLPLTGLLALVGCAPVDVLNFMVPRDGYKVQSNIAYGDNPCQTLDIYTPDAAKDGKLPVIVFFYGGSWQTGKKEDYRFVGQAFASEGFVTVIADYRVYPEVYFPAFVDDGAHAFKWVHDNIAQYGGDTNKLFLAGHSAGAHIAVMLTANPHYLKAAGANPQWVKGAIGISGPYDFLPMTDPKIIALFSKVKDTDTQPITFARRGLPPMLLVTGTDDTQVGPHNTRDMTAKLRALGDDVEEREYKGVGHIGAVLALARGFRGKAPVLHDIVEFLKSK